MAPIDKLNVGARYLRGEWKPENIAEEAESNRELSRKLRAMSGLPPEEEKVRVEPMPLRLRLRELAARINEHLTRFEADPVINARDPAKRGGLQPFYGAHSTYAGGNKICVRYISFQGLTFLTRDEATRYLAKLDAGFVGRHFEAFREGRTT